MTVLYIVCLAALLTSFIADRKKTAQALKRALMKFLKVLPAFGMMLVLVSIVLFLIPEETLVKYLGGQRSAGSIGIAALLGSITMMPGFIAFPLCGILLDSGIPWSVIAAFSTSLMLVGVVSFPLEKHYLGFRLTLIRNLFALLMSFIIALSVGFIYGEFIL